MTKPLLAILAILIATGMTSCKSEKSEEPRPEPKVTAPIASPSEPTEASGGVHQAFQASMNAFNALDLDSAVSIFSGNHELMMADSKKPSVKGRSEMKRLLKKVHVAFPDVHLAPKRILDGGEIWVLEAVITGTHHGDFLGVAGSHKQVGGQFTMFSWVKDGKITKSFLCGNPLAVIKQMQAPEGKAPWRPVLPDRHEMVKASGSLAYIEATKAFFKTFETGDLSVLPLIMAPEVVTHAYGDGIEIRGLQALRQALSAERDGFKGRIDVEHVASVGPYVAALVFIRGTYKGELGAKQATGKSFAERGVDVFRFQNGKIVEWDNYRNLMDLLSQLGLYP